jgi:hypothetical protein
MKEFLMLIREPANYGQLSPEEMQADIEKHIQWVMELAEQGHFKEGNPLDAAGVTIKGTQKQVTDGPFIESKECISGYYFLLAESLDQAVTIAKGCPSLELGHTLEIRAIVNTDEHADA